MGETRKCGARENGGGARKIGKRREREIRRLPLSPVSSRFFFVVRAFSIPRARLSRSLGQAKVAAVYTKRHRVIS